MLCQMFGCDPPHFQIGDWVRSEWQDANTGEDYLDRGIVTGISLESGNPHVGAIWVYQVTWYEMGMAESLQVELPYTEDAYDENLEPDSPSVSPLFAQLN